MRVFPTRVLLATDGSEEASRAADAAMELCEKHSYRRFALPKTCAPDSSGFSLKLVEVGVRGTSGVFCSRKFRGPGPTAHAARGGMLA